MRAKAGQICLGKLYSMLLTAVLRRVAGGDRPWRALQYSSVTSWIRVNDVYRKPTKT